MSKLTCLGALDGQSAAPDHLWPIKSHLGLQAGHLGPPGKSVWTSGISLRVITQGQRQIVENPREVYRNLKGSTSVCKEAIWHFLGFQRDHSGLKGDDLWLHRCHLGPLGSHLGAQGCPWELLEYPSRPQKEELYIKQETYGGDIPLIRAEMRAFSCVIFILTPFLNGLS